MEIYLKDEDEVFIRQDKTIEHEEEEIRSKEKHQKMALEVKERKSQVDPKSSRRKGMEEYKQRQVISFLSILITISSLLIIAHGSLLVQVEEEARVCTRKLPWFLSPSSEGFGDQDFSTRKSQDFYRLVHILSPLLHLVLVRCQGLSSQHK